MKITDARKVMLEHLAACDYDPVKCSKQYRHDYNTLQCLRTYAIKEGIYSPPDKTAAQHLSDRLLAAQHPPDSLLEVQHLPDHVLHLFRNERKTVSAIMRSTGLSRYKINQILADNNEFPLTTGYTSVNLEDVYRHLRNCGWDLSMTHHKFRHSYDTMYKALTMYGINKEDLKRTHTARKKINVLQLADFIHLCSDNSAILHGHSRTGEARSGSTRLAYILKISEHEAKQRRLNIVRNLRRGNYFKADSAKRVSGQIRNATPDIIINDYENEPYAICWLYFAIKYPDKTRAEIHSILYEGSGAYRKTYDSMYMSHPLYDKNDTALLYDKTDVFLTHFCTIGEETVKNPVRYPLSKPFVEQVLNVDAPTANRIYRMLTKRDDFIWPDIWGGHL